jgi:hypothetical protein
VRKYGVRITVRSEKDRKKRDDEKGDKEVTSAASDEGGQSSPPFFRQNGIPPIDIDFCGGL